MLTNLQQQLKIRRKDLGLSAARLAELAGTQPYQIINFENGKANITVKILEKICKALGICLTTKNAN